MGLFDIFKKKQVELTEEQRKWNKMWELWAEKKAEAPYSQLMTYQSEVNNGGHDQYFTNVENTSDLQNEISVLETILPVKHRSNFLLGTFHIYACFYFCTASCNHWYRTCKLIISRSRNIVYSS